MKQLLFFPLVMSALLSAQSASVQPLVSIETVTVGDSGNAPDTRVMWAWGDGTSGYGSVSSVYKISKYEVTIGQYATFLNSVAAVASNDYLVSLWNSNMETNQNIAGIGRSGSGTSSDPYVYTVIGSVNRPITYVGWFDAARFANWVNNGATNGASTEVGAYNLNGATNGIEFTRNPAAKWSLPSEDQWYKAAYYKGGSTNAGYWLYPTRSDSAPSADYPPGGPNSANYGHRQGEPWGSRPISDNLTDVGSYIGSPGPYGTFDQGGNVWEWTEGVATNLGPQHPEANWRIHRGNDWATAAFYMQADIRNRAPTDYNESTVGFRLVRSLPRDTDGDGVNDYRETADGTNPNDSNSFNPLSKGLVAYYPFDGNANDESGYDENGEVFGAIAATGILCKEQGAFRFEGTTNWIKVPVAGDVFTNDYTISIWAKPTNFVAGSGGQTFMLAGNLGAVNLAFGGAHDPLYGGHASFYMFRSNPWTQVPVSGTGLWSDRPVLSYEWSHVVVSRSNSTHRIYLDGKLSSEATDPVTFPLEDTFIEVGNSFRDPRGSHFLGSLDNLRFYNRALGPGEIARLSYQEGFSPRQQEFAEQNPGILGHYSLADFTANRTNGRLDVATNPSAFNLFTQEQFNNNRTAGRSDVISDPLSYGLYTSSSIMDFRMGGLMIQRQGTNAVVSFQPQTTTDLTQPFTNNGTPITHEIPMPGNKGFIRINAKPIATPTPPN